MSKPRRVGPYTLLSRLGRGGMGEVYLADTRRGERVAVKLLRESLDDNHDARLRLEREVRALRRVESPHVARVIDADLEGDRPYLVMEHIEGETLLERVRRGGPFGEPELFSLAHGIAAALASIHAAGVVHRDLKPANVLLGPDGPTLIDFGIAQLLDATRLTQTGAFLGTPGYAAPELFAEEPVGEPADVHAWGATVAFAATGRPTFGQGTAEARMYAILNGQADLAGVPAALLPLVRAALNRSPGKRPTAAVLADRLARLARAASHPGRAAACPTERARLAASHPDRPPHREAGTGPGGSARAPAGPSAASTAERGGSGRRAAATGKRPGDGSKDTGTAVREPEGEPGGDAARERGKGPSADAAERGRRVAADAVAERGRAPGGDARGDRRKRPGNDAARGRVRRSAPDPAGRGRDPRVGGSVTVVVLAVAAVPCVVAAVIWPPAVFGATAAGAVLARALWISRWAVRNRRSPRARLMLRIAVFPLACVGSALSALAWPGLPAGAAAGVTLWAFVGRDPGPQWLEQPLPVTVAGVVFGVLCGGLVGREVDRVAPAIPGLRKEALRTLAVFGGFVALCAATVRAISLVF